MCRALDVSHARLYSANSRFRADPAISGEESSEVTAGSAHAQIAAHVVYAGSEGPLAHGDGRGRVYYGGRRGGMASRGAQKEAGRHSPHHQRSARYTL